MSVEQRRWPLPTAAAVALCLLLGLAATSAVPHTAYAMEVRDRASPRVQIRDRYGRKEDDLQGADPLSETWPRHAHRDGDQQDYCTVPLPRPRSFFRRRPAPGRWSCMSPCVPQGSGAAPTCRVVVGEKRFECELCPVQLPRDVPMCAAKPRLSRYQRQCLDRCSYSNGVAPKCHWDSRKRFWHAPLFRSVGYSRCGVCQGKYIDHVGDVQDTTKPAAEVRKAAHPRSSRKGWRSNLPTF